MMSISSSSELGSLVASNSRAESIIIPLRVDGASRSYSSYLLRALPESVGRLGGGVSAPAPFMSSGRKK